MNSKERVIAALKRESVDYVPCTFSFNPLCPVSRRGYQWQFPWSEKSSEEEKLEYQVRKLGLDQVVDVNINLCRSEGCMKSKVWIEGDVLHKVYITSSGELHAAVRYNELWPHGEDIPFYSDFNIGHFVKPWIETESDLQCFKKIRQICETKEVLNETREKYRVSKKLADRYGLATISHIGLGLSGALQLFGTTGLCLAVVDNPELVENYLDYEHNINMRSISIAGDLGVDITRRNGFYETADFYSPSLLEKFLGKRLRQEANMVKEVGMLSSYTVNTGVMPILDYLDNLPFDSIFGIDIAFKDVDLFKIHNKLASKKSFWIGPSSIFHLWKGPDVTRQAVRNVFDVFTDRRGLILVPCVSAHSIMPWESSLAMIDEWKKLR